MKKYKALLTGKNNTAFDDFFIHLSNTFESMTTSIRYEDIVNHLKYYNPDIFVYCMSNENSADISKVLALRGQLRKESIPFVVIGSDEDCNYFTQYAVSAADLILVKPITANTIESRIVSYLEKEERLREEAAHAEEERLAQEEKKSCKKHVLVVDDDPLMLKMIKEHLRGRYDVATAASGKIALKFLEKKKTDLILLDYEMPSEDGPAILEKLHANDATKDIPVVFLTGITERSKIQKALLQNPQGYLLKPIDRDKLLEIIEKFVG